MSYSRPFLQWSREADDCNIPTLVFSAANFPSISVWTLFGSALRRLLREPRSVQRFNIGMALLLVTSLYPIVLEYFAG